MARTKKVRKGRRKTVRGGKLSDLFRWGSRPVQPPLPAINVGVPAINVGVPAINVGVPVAQENLVRQPNLNGGPMLRLQDEIAATEEMVKSACVECDAMKDILASKKKEYSAKRKAINTVLGPALSKARNNSPLSVARPLSAVLAGSKPLTIKERQQRTMNAIRAKKNAAAAAAKKTRRMWRG